MIEIGWRRWTSGRRPALSGWASSLASRAANSPAGPAVGASRRRGGLPLGHGQRPRPRARWQARPHPRPRPRTGPPRSPGRRRQRHSRHGVGAGAGPGARRPPGLTAAPAAAQRRGQTRPPARPVRLARRAGPRWVAGAEPARQDTAPPASGPAQQAGTAAGRAAAPGAPQALGGSRQVPGADRRSGAPGAARLCRSAARCGPRA